MLRPLADYRCLAFDCDGVVLDSNAVKTQAFHQVALPFGAAAAQAFVDYHQANGGISRYRKFEYLLQQIVRVDDVQEHLPVLLEQYAGAVRKGLLACAVAPGLLRLRKLLPQSRWMIVSGGDEAELREVFAMRGLDVLFDGGIFGSPTPKDIILAREQASGNLLGPALFLGDSRFDHQCAQGAGLDFVFLQRWSEFHGAPGYFAGKPVVQCSDIQALLEAESAR
ncbi:HAD family hydrolase [Pseudomonas sp. BGr12]|uniref:HAD family hydrolase n=1 Tax=unclassified Pseudomonas TaxID=196821 RepID=UPI00178285FD|nr:MULTISPECIES: HAD family hydrolase [unclassified Pseudomonas]MBD9501519.1 HAD family hydrolase [Pseudomonas sp. PDM17]MBD9576477.1 HAD family hydrolase [Pseudomonas sp. PDM23]MBD9670404.1 HAD family hydrolase [Pseudomonas sp. PDM21]MDL2427137.1 HAD hydrolase-like protein [Pseudomonas sp. BJa5]